MEDEMIHFELGNSRLQLQDYTSLVIKLPLLGSSEMTKNINITYKYHKNNT